VTDTGKRSFIVYVKRRCFQVRWLRYKPFLYEVVYRGARGHARPHKASIYLGQIDESVVRRGAVAVGALLRRDLPPVAAQTSSRRRAQKKRPDGGM
jgi:hypothetical protein